MQKTQKTYKVKKEQLKQKGWDFSIFDFEVPENLVINFEIDKTVKDKKVIGYIETEEGKLISPEIASDQESRKEALKEVKEIKNNS